MQTFVKYLDITCSGALIYVFELRQKLKCLHINVSSNGSIYYNENGLIEVLELNLYYCCIKYHIAFFN